MGRGAGAARAPLPPEIEFAGRGGVCVCGRECGGAGAVASATMFACFNVRVKVSTLD